MGGFDVSYAGAFGAGALSFLSPCVLPLIPAYLCFLGGVSLDQLTGKENEGGGVDRSVLRAAIAFVIGFSSVFIVMGATASALNKLVMDNMTWLSVAAGIVIIVFGLHYMGALRIGFLNFEKRVHVEQKPAGLVGAFVLGLAFAFGWTPCVGPILATILMIAAGGESVWYGTSLLSAYAAGLGIPFLIAAFAAKPFMAFLGRFKRHMRKVELSIGGLLVVTGVLILSGKMNVIGNWLMETVPAFQSVG
ncbi:cytochrome c biogenesis CcdA family protein [Magnetospirillum sp. UT-4]|uniref:cytochrome c biogenesis CcdA family protein n=1 Tax=Magnetospirillum sp. UT-4 TaxID=2681467 RepID=UPI00137E190E|nr:cytochrome c biogenesis protein CcdA [Magnetospirillum sp. UT-4]CAA7622951.1 putative cytochrome c assembly protein, transmembrane domain [Magnetospirillum sp. UT-4]